MIKLERVRSREAIYGGLRDAWLTRKKRQLLASARDTGGEPNFKSHWGNASGQLKKETANKCGYCETPIERGDVDHFRPKAHYWWLVYCYDNFVYSCPVCNQEYKSDNFPILANKLAGPGELSGLNDQELEQLLGSFAPDPLDNAAVARFHRHCLDEEPLLPDPYLEDPEPLFSWVADNILEEVEIKVPDGVGERERQRFKALEQYCGLNREGLRKRRFRTFRLLRQFKSSISLVQNLKDSNADLAAVIDSLQDILPKQLRDDLPFNNRDRCFDMIIEYYAGEANKMTAADQPYAAMVRYLSRADSQPDHDDP